MAKNMKFHKVTLTLLWIYCLGFLLTPVPLAEARVSVTEEWRRTYNGPFNYGDSAIAVAADSAGNVCVTGACVSPYDLDFATIKYSSEGVLLWQARYNWDVDLPKAIAVDGSCNVYVTGKSDSPSGAVPEERLVTIKYNSIDGSVLWQREVHNDYNQYDRVVGMALDSSGNVYVTCNLNLTYAGFDGSQILMIKYGPDGDTIWERRIGTGIQEYIAYAMTLDSHDNVCVTGVRRDQDEYFVFRYSTNGVFQWERGDSAGTVYPTAIEADGSNNLYIFGSYWDGSKSSYYMLKLDSEGNTIWASLKDPEAQNLVNPVDMKVDAAGNVYATGYADSAHSESDYYTLKYNTAGELQWAFRYTAPGATSSRAMRLALDQHANVYVTGTADLSSFSAIATVSYDPAGVLRWEAMGGSVPGRPTRLPSTPKEKGIVKRFGRAADLVLDLSGKVFVAGGVRSGSESWNTEDFLTIKYQQGIRKPGKPIPPPLP